MTDLLIVIGLIILGAVLIGLNLWLLKKQMESWKKKESDKNKINK